MNNAGEPPTEDLNDLYENAPCGYVSILPDGRIVKANATFSSWIGFDYDQLVAMRLHDLLNVAGRIFFETHFAPLLRMQGFFNEVALDLTTRLGERLPVLVNAAERRDATGRHVFTRLTFFKATDRRRYERELLQARKTAEAAAAKLEQVNVNVNAMLLDEQATAALREEFIAVLGHDLRNPLSAVNAAATLILRLAPDEAIARAAGTIQASASRMAGLIENLLDFARGRLGGGIPLDRRAEPDLTRALIDVVDELRVGNPEAMIDARFELQGAIDCDRRRIAQLLSNLLANALTHGKPGEPIAVRASTSNGVFELSVANAGEPIAPATMERLFQPFYRGDVRASQQGLGLGLYIAHQIAVAHGGTLQVQSSAEVTRFTFKMPQSARDA